MKGKTHCEKVLEVLADGKAHSTADLYRRCGGMILHSRVSDLRKQGHNIVCERIPHAQGAAAYQYTLLPNARPKTPHEKLAELLAVPGALPADQLRLDSDMIAPRIPSQQYRIVRVKNGGEPEIVGAVATQEEIGPALCAWGAEGMFDDYCVGLLDVLDHKKPGTNIWVGKWLVKPWVAKKRRDAA